MEPVVNNNNNVAAAADPGKDGLWVDETGAPLSKEVRKAIEVFIAKVGNGAAAPKGQPNAGPTPAAQKSGKAICKHFAKGKCTYGDKCKFLHVASSETSSGDGEPATGLVPETVEVEEPLPTRIELECRLESGEFAKLKKLAPYQILNGKKVSDHAWDNAVRQVLYSSVLINLLKKGKVTKIVDISGKQRPMPFIEDIQPEYPHICREIRDPRDAIWASTHNAHAFPCANAKPHDVNMSVDVLTKVEPEQVAAWCRESAQGWHYAIFHDLMRGCGPETQLVSVNGQLMFTSDIRGHTDTTPDLYQPWLFGSCVPLSSGEMLCFDEYGCTIGNMKTYRFRVTPKFATTERKLDGNIWGHLFRGLNKGTHCFNNPIGVEDSTVDVGNKYVVFRGGAKPLVLLVETMEGLAKILGPNTITAENLRAATRKYQGQYKSNCDQITLEAFVDGLVASRVRDSVRANHRLPMLMSLWHWFKRPTADDFVQTQELLNPVIPDKEITPAKPSIVTLKALMLFVRSTPQILAALPLIAAIWLYFRRKRGEFRALFPYAVDSVMTTNNAKYDRAFWGWFGTAVTRPLTRRERFGLWVKDKALPAITSIASGSATVATAVVGTVNAVKTVVQTSRSGLASLITVTSGDYLRDCVVSPVLEESYKEANARLATWFLPQHLRPRGLALNRFASGAGFGLYEFVTFVRAGVPWYVRVPALMMHVAVMSIKSLPLRVLAHSGFNVGVHAVGSSLTSLIGGPARGEYPGYVMPVDTPLPPLDDEAKIKFIYQGVRVEPRPEFMVSLVQDIDRPRLFLNGIAATQRPMVQAGCIWNMYVGMRERALKKRPGSIGNKWKEACALFPKSGQREVEWATFKEWNARYPPARRRANEEQWRKCVDYGCSREYKFGLFLKIELNHSTDDDLKAPRVVHAWDGVEPTIISGPPIWSIGRTMAKEFDGMLIHRNIHGTPIICLINSGNGEGGRSQAQRFADLVELGLAWLVRCPDTIIMALSGDDNFTMSSINGEIVIITTDGKRWDLHLDGKAHDEIVEYFRDFMYYSHYVGIYWDTRVQVPGIPMLETLRVFDAAKAGKFVKRFYKEEQLGETALKGTMPPEMHSGVAWTTHGNNYANGSACISMWERLKGDYVAFEDIPQAVEEHYRELGIPVEIGVYRDPAQADFCSMRLMPVGGRYYAVYRPGKFIRRYGWSVGSPRTAQEMRAIVDQLYKYKNVPFIGSMIKATSRLLPKISKQEAKELFETTLRDETYKTYFGDHFVVPEPDESTWAWFSDVYGVTKDDADRFEIICSAITSLPWQLPAGAHDQLVAVDA